MTDTYDSHPLLDDGGQWLPQPATARHEVSARGETVGEAIEALYELVAESWAGWRMGADIQIGFGPRTQSGAYLYFATADITKQTTP